MSARTPFQDGYFTREKAIISPGDQYRYWLSRDLQALQYDHEFIIWLMLNPSTANANQDDPTVRRVCGFSRRFAAKRVGVVNLFARRTTYPVDLFNEGEAAAIGPGNDDALTGVFTYAVANRWPVVAAWGAVSVSAEAKRYIKARAVAVCAMASQHKLQLRHIGLAEDGSPRHPLMMPYAAVLGDYGGQ